jgi:hypothetical protein
MIFHRLRRYDFDDLNDQRSALKLLKSFKSLGHSPQHSTFAPFPPAAFKGQPAHPRPGHTFSRERGGDSTKPFGLQAT